MNLHIWAWSKIFEHIQKLLKTVKNIWTWSKIFELADGIGIKVQNEILDRLKYFGLDQKWLFGTWYWILLFDPCPKMFGGNVQNNSEMSKVFWTNPKQFAYVQYDFRTIKRLVISVPYLHYYNSQLVFFFNPHNWKWFI